MYNPDEALRYADSFLKYNDEPVEFDPWQEYLVKDQSPFIILLKGRQEGFSFAVAAKKFIELQSPDVKNMTVQFVSYNLSDAIEKIRYISIMAQSIPEKHRKRIAYETKTSIEFYDPGEKTTCRLISIACRPVRGKPGDVVLDEFAIYGVNKAKMIYTSALPSITRGGNIIIGSTPLGTIGMFYEIYSNKKDYKNFQRYTVPWWQSGALCKNIIKARTVGVKDMETDERVRLWGKKILRMEYTALDLQSFQQEYECVFIDSAESFIPLKLIYRNTPGMRDEDRADALDEGQGEIDDNLEVRIFKTVDDLILGYRLELHGRLFLGYDVARHRDASVIFLIGQTKTGKKMSVAEIEMINVPFRIQKENMRRILRELPVVRGTMDRSGLGMQLCEELQEEFGETMIEGMDFTPASKELLAVSVKKGLENNEFLLQNDKKFHRQVHSIKRMTGTGSIFRYDSQRDEDGHADSFWAWALANIAVIEGEKRSNFYDEWASQKAKTILQSPNSSKPSSNPVPENLTPRRGKSLSSVLGGLQNAYK